MLDAKRPGSESDADPFNEELLSPRRSPAQQGLSVVAFVNHSAVCRSALQLVTRGVLGNSRCRQLTLAYCASNAYTTESMNGVLEALASSVSGMAVRTRLFSKQADQTVVEALQELVEQERPDLVVIASNSLPCIDQRTTSGAGAGASSASGGKGGPAAALSPAERSSAAQTLSMRLCQALRGVPLLVYKANTRGSFQEGAPQAAVKYMVDLQPTSRHMLDWLMGSLMDLRRDSLSLAVSKALEPNGTTKQMALRMMTAFGVQASVNKLTPTKRLLREEAGKALPPAVVEEEVDVLLIQVRGGGGGVVLSRPPAGACLRESLTICFSLTLLTSLWSI